MYGIAETLGFYRPSVPHMCSSQFIDGTAQRLRALRKTQQIVRMLAIILRFDVLVAIVSGHDYPDGFTGNTNPECVFARFDVGNSLRLAHLPPTAVGVHAAYTSDALVSVIAIGLIDATDLHVCCHVSSPCQC